MFSKPQPGTLEGEHLANRSEMGARGMLGWNRGGESVGVILSRGCLLILLVLLPTATTAGESQAETERPNIVLIVADDLGFSDLGCYGGEIRTPHLDRLAEGGLRFTQFYNNAICVATRASLMSGLYSQQVDRGKIRNCATIAEILRSAGYRTWLAGKWHLSGKPTERGFDRSYGLLTGCCNHFNPGSKRPGEKEPGKKFPGDNQPFAIDDRVIQPYTPEPDFYSTDAFTDYALKFLKESSGEESPFFLYVAYTVPHYPLHAWPEDIAKYRKTYQSGWDLLRKKRFERMVEMGLIREEWGLSPRSPHAPAWQDVSDREAWARKIAVYAAMVDRMDQNIGRILDQLHQMGEAENTLVLFFSDNGPSDEDRTSTPDIPPGKVESYRTVDLPWANLSNTPFRHFKRWNHEGGISSPLIVSWPRVIQQEGRITREVAHVIDILPTCLDVARADYPDSFQGRPIPSYEGRSLRPVFEGRSLKEDRTLFWNQNGLWRAVREGKWKLVSPDYTHQYNPWRLDRKGRTTQPPPEDPNALWELYDMEADRTEQHDLSDRYPQHVQKMIRKYKAWKRHVSQ